MANIQGGTLRYSHWEIICNQVPLDDDRKFIHPPLKLNYPYRSISAKYVKADTKHVPIAAMKDVVMTAAISPPVNMLFRSNDSVRLIHFQHRLSPAFLASQALKFRPLLSA
jgi:hypothetical protein